MPQRTTPRQLNSITSCTPYKDKEVQMTTLRIAKKNRHSKKEVEKNGGKKIKYLLVQKRGVFVR